MMRCAVIAAAALVALATNAAAETKQEWIDLGTRVHGGFGPFLTVGIRIGLDAMERLKTGKRGVTVTYYNSDTTPCPCIADGAMIATQATPGQNLIEIVKEKAPEGSLAVIVIRNRKTGEGLTYTIAATWLPKILGWLPLDPSGRYDAGMAAENLFTVEPAPAL